MNDEELTPRWRALEPRPAQRRRIEARVRLWLEARSISLAEEWLALLKITPVAGLGLAAVAAALLFLVTPLSWTTFMLLAAE